MALWRELKLLVTSSTHLFEDRIVSQIITLDGGIADKIVDRIGIIRQLGKRFEKNNNV